MKASARAEVLQVGLARFVGGPVRVEIAPDYGELEQLLRQREAELGWAPPALCALLQGEVHAVLTAVRRGRASYGAALVCRADAGLRLDTLQGRRAAWVDPLSAGGHLLPRAHLLAAGIDPDGTLSSQVFAGSYRDAVLAVVRGEADLAPVYAAAADRASATSALADLIGGLAERVVPFSFTGQTPSDGLIVSRRLEPEQASALAARFVAAPPPIFLEAIDAEALRPALPEDYDSLRPALCAPTS